MNIDGSGRPYTAEEWEAKLCKGENSLLAQKKRKIKERAEKGVPALEAPMRTSRVIKATPPKYVDKGRQELIDQIEQAKWQAEDYRRRRKEGEEGEARYSGVQSFADKRGLYRELARVKKLERKLGNYGKELTPDEKRLNEVLDELDDIDVLLQAPIPSASFADRSQITRENKQVKSQGDLRTEKTRLQRKLKGSGELSSNNTIKGGSMDRLRKLLDAHPVSSQDTKKNEQGYSREAERSLLNTADARYNKQVYQNEVRGANLYEQSQMPPSPADVGVSFKIGSFVNKLSQLLGFKTDLSQQLQTLLSLSTTPSPVRLIQDARLISVSADFFKMTDIIATYNELVNYIQLYAPQMTINSDFATGVNTTYLLPLIQLLKQTGQIYLSSFNAVPEGARGSAPARRAFEAFRNGASAGYSTVMLMADNLNNGIYSNVSKKDVERYEEGKQIKTQVFGRNPLPVAPAPLPPAPLQPIVPPGQQGQDPNAPPQPAQPQPAPAQQGDFADAQELVRAYAQDRQQQGLAYDQVLNTRRLGNAGNLIADIRSIANQATNQRISGNSIKTALPIIRAELVAQAQAQQGQRPPSPVGPQQPAQRQPSVPRRPQRQLGAVEQAYANDGGTDRNQNANYVLRPVPELDGIENTDVWNTYTNLEDTEGRAIAPAEHRLLFDALPPALISKLRRQQPDGSFDLDADTASQDSIEPWIRNVQQIRQAWANAYGRQIGQQIDSATLYGLGNEEFLRGSGIFDTLKDWASKTADSASGWFNTVANNMPTMSDVRRGVSRILPDSAEKYLPSGLQRTFTDKAKDFFGFGRGELEDRKRLAELALGDNRTVDMSQGRKLRETMMPFIAELDPKAEFLKRRGVILSGGVEDGIHTNINDQLPYETFGGNVDYDDFEEATPFKRRIGMPNPFAKQPKMDILPMRPIMETNGEDYDEKLVPFQQIFGSTRAGFEKEKEKPKDLDENPDPIRITNENWKVFTGKLKAPKYRLT